VTAGRRCGRVGAGRPGRLYVASALRSAAGELHAVRLQFGIFTVGDIIADPATGRAPASSGASRAPPRWRTGPSRSAPGGRRVLTSQMLAERLAEGVRRALAAGSRPADVEIMGLRPPAGPKKARPDRVVWRVL